MNRILITVLCLYYLINALQAQNTAWQKVPRLYGGHVQSLTKTNSNALYATTSAEKEVYRSDNGGDNWQLVYELAAGDYSPYIGNAGTFYVKKGAVLYKSSDEGQTWSPMDTATNKINGFVEMPSGVLVGCNNEYLWVSQDGGTTWAQVCDYPLEDNLDINRLDITPFGGLLAKTYVGNNDTINIWYRSIDEGQSWQRLLIPKSFSVLFIAPSGTIFTSTPIGGLHRSTDMGQTFDPVPGAPNVGGDYMTALPSGRILAIAQGQLFFSDDDGVNWQTTNVHLDGWSGMYPITPLADGSIFSQAQYSFYKSSDGGQNWHFSANGLRGGEVQQMHFISDSIFYASGYSGVWKTSDAGQNWNPLTANRTIQNAGSFKLTSSGGLVAVQDDKLLWSPTGNLPLVDVTPPDGLLFGLNRVMVNPHNDHFFISTKKGVARSTDHGQNWQTVLDSVFGNYATFLPSGRILAVANYKHIIVSDDEGLSWDTVAIPSVNNLGNIMTTPNGDVYAVALINNNLVQLLKSEDAGASWYLLKGDIDFYQFWDADLFAIAANGHLFRNEYESNKLFLSVNGGLSWQSFPEPVPSASPYSTFNLSVSPDQYLYVHMYGESYKTVNPVTQGAYINGHARVDADADCSTPDAQQGLNNWIVQASGPFDYFTQTNADGQYTFFVDTGAYQVSLVPVNDIWWSVCDSTQTVLADSLFATDTADFAAVSTSDCPLITVDLAVSNMRRCFDNTAYLQYCNQGSEAADSAYIDVELDPFLGFVSSAQPHNDLGNNTIRFFLGDVASGDCGQFDFVFHVDCDSTILGQTHCIRAHGYPDTLCTSVPDWSGAEIRAEVECADSIIRLKLHNAGNAPSETLDYIIIEDDVVLMNGNQQYDPGETFTLEQPANGHTWRIESIQEPGHPFSERAVAFAEGCGGFETLGFINQFEVNSFQPSYDVICRDNTGSYDPNDKQGFPLGAGPEHRIRPGQDIEYLIRFQNTGTDTAFTVVIVDTLSQWLDPALLRPSAASHHYTWQIDGPGVIKFTFANILLPDSNVNLAGSQGFVSFKIAQQPGVPLNTQILNSAAIYFDFNLPIITNQTLHTIGFDESVATGEANSDAAANGIVVAPNPVRESALFSRSNGSLDQHRIEISDAAGRVVHSAIISGKQYLFQRKNLPEGVYFFQVADKAGNPVDTGVLMLGGQ